MTRQQELERIHQWLVNHDVKLYDTPQDAAADLANLNKTSPEQSQWRVLSTTCTGSRWQWFLYREDAIADTTDTLSMFYRSDGKILYF